MRKFIGLVVVAALVVSLIPAQASAVSLSGGEEYLAKFKDVSNLYAQDDEDPELEAQLIENPALPGAIVVGDEQRTLSQVTNIFDSGGNVVFDTSSPTELSALLYDLRVLAVTATSTGVVIDFGQASSTAGRNPITNDLIGPGGTPDAAGPDGLFGTADDPTDPVDAHNLVFAGVLEIYEDAGTGYTQDPNGAGAYQSQLPSTFPVPAPASRGPNAWVEGSPPAGHVVGAAPGPGGADAFPLASDGSLWLAATLIDLNYLVNVGVVASPGIPFAAGTVLRESLDFSTGSGSGFGYLNVLGGSVASSLELGLAAPFADLSILFDLNTPILDVGQDGIPGTADDLAKDTLVYQGLGYWQIDSEDPVVFATVIPEPTSLSLLGLSLVGLVGVLRRRMGR